MSIKQIDLISEEQKALANINAITLDIVNSKIQGNNLIYRWFVDLILVFMPALPLLLPFQFSRNFLFVLICCFLPIIVIRRRWSNFYSDTLKSLRKRLPAEFALMKKLEKYEYEDLNFYVSLLHNKDAMSIYDLGFLKNKELVIFLIKQVMKNKEECFS